MGSADIICPRYANDFKTKLKHHTGSDVARENKVRVFIANQDNNVKMVTDEQNKIKIRRKNTYIGTWNVRTLREEGKLEELTHELDIYRWTVVGLCEIRRKGVNEIQTTEGQQLYYIGNDNKHINGVGFLINSEVTPMVMCFTPINDRIAIIRLHATPFNISIIQVYAPTTDHTDEEIETFYNELQNSISKISKKDIMVIQGDMNAKIGKDAHNNWGSTSGIFCN